MNAGSLRDQIDLQRPVTRNEDGWGGTTAWKIYASPFANVTAQSAEDTSGRIATYSIRVRYIEGVTSEHQVRYRGKSLGISSAIDPDGKRRELLITASEYAQAVK